jgi:Ca-activated chloride channel family protein
MIFRFAHPFFLLLLLLVPVWVWVRSSARFHSALHFPSASLLRSLPASAVRRLHPVLHLLAGLGLSLLIVALARPQTGLQRREVETDTVDIVLALDTSTSMQAIDPGNEDDRNRLDAVKDVAIRFVEARELDRIGLISFAAMPFTKCPPTLDHDWLTDRIGDLRTGELPDGTAIGNALASAVNRLRNSETASRIIILLSDGVNSAGDIAPLDAAPLAEELGIRVYTIAAGSDGPVRVPVQNMFGQTIYRQTRIPVDTDTLSRIAEITGGRFFRAEDEGELQRVFEEIDELERTDIELTEYTLYTEQFMWVALAGAGLLLLERMLSAGRFGRVLA